MDIMAHIGMIEDNLKYFQHTRITIRNWRGRLEKYYISKDTDIAKECTRIANKIGDGHSVIKIESYVTIGK